MRQQGASGDGFDRPQGAREDKSRLGSAMSISIAVPVLNDAWWLGGAIESVLAQTHQNWELVISDNASSDDLSAIVARYEDPRIRYHRWSRRVNVSESHNRALALSRFEWVQMLSADDRLDPCCLERLTACIERTTPPSGRLVMVVTGCKRVDICGHPADIGRNDTISYRPVPYKRMDDGVYDAARWLRVNAAPGLRPWMLGSAAISRELLQEIGGFRSEMGLCSDLELAMRVAAYGDVAYITDPLLRYSVRPDSTTRQLEEWHMQQGSSMVDTGVAWLSVLTTHESRRRVTQVERADIHAAIARAFLRRALLQRQAGGSGHRAAAMDVLRALRYSPRTVVGNWRLAVAMAALVAPRDLVERAAVVGHRFGLIVV
jgi:GT2 family glycosyltransferase